MRTRTCGKHQFLRFGRQGCTRQPRVCFCTALPVCTPSLGRRHTSTADAASSRTQAASKRSRARAPARARCARAPTRARELIARSLPRIPLPLLADAASYQCSYAAQLCLMTTGMPPMAFHSVAQPVFAAAGQIWRAPTTHAPARQRPRVHEDSHAHAHAAALGPSPARPILRST